jgi:hypothetical protein
MTVILDGGDDPVPLCSLCTPYRRRRKQKRPDSAVRLMERRRVEMLLYSHHTSWGSMDLIKADPRLISGQHPLSLAPDHLVYTPLSLEQAVCLSSAYIGGHNYHSSFELNKSDTVGFDLMDTRMPEIMQLHIRNLVLLLRHDLLCGDYANAAETLATLLPERRLIPDVTFKSCIQVLRAARSRSPCQGAALHEQQTPLQYLLRGLLKLSAHPREIQVHQELASSYIAVGNFGQALRDLQDSLSLGRPYMGHVRYHGLVGSLSCVSLYNILETLRKEGRSLDRSLDASVMGGVASGADAAEAAMEEGEDTTQREQEGDASFMSTDSSSLGLGNERRTDYGASGAGAKASRQALELVRRGRLLAAASACTTPSFTDETSDDKREKCDDGASEKGAEGGDGGHFGLHDHASHSHTEIEVGACIASCVSVGRLPKERKRITELEDYERAVKELTRALLAERIDALSAHLVCVRCLAGQWKLAAQEVLQHAEQHPLGVNSWRRFAEFRNALEWPPLRALLAGHGTCVRFLMEDEQSQAATQPSHDHAGDHDDLDAEEREAEAEALAMLEPYPLPVVVMRWLQLDAASKRALAALQELVRQGRAERSQLLSGRSRGWPERVGEGMGGGGEEGREEEK